VSNPNQAKVKRPAFQFYPGDWLQDVSLRMCSVGARGLWIDMICLMHQGSDYGYLKVNHLPILPDNLARMCGATFDEVQGWLGELEKAGTFSRDADGCIYSRRMIRDEEVRSARAAGGKLGGNPALKKGGKPGKKSTKKDNLPSNLQPTPSSSSSSSSSPSPAVKDPSAGSADARLDPPAGDDEPVDERTPGAKAWDAYADAYRQTYRVEPLLNAKVRTQFKRFATELVPGDEAAELAAFYVGHPDPFYRKNAHSVDLLIRDAAKLRTEWASRTQLSGVPTAGTGSRQAARDAWNRGMDDLGEPPFADGQLFGGSHAAGYAG
jgi:hypothetical protein